jgi:phage terminase large subunit GpA-like protein
MCRAGRSRHGVGVAGRQIVVPNATAPLKEMIMARCDVCGNDYDQAFQVTMGGKTSTFDSFECAIHACAPTCAHCGCKIVGHGVQAGASLYCCAHCSQQAGAKGLRDRV